MADGKAKELSKNSPSRTAESSSSSTNVNDDELKAMGIPSLIRMALFAFDSVKQNIEKIQKHVKKEKRPSSNSVAYVVEGFTEKQNQKFMIYLKNIFKNCQYLEFLEQLTDLLPPDEDEGILFASSSSTTTTTNSPPHSSKKDEKEKEKKHKKKHHEKKHKKKHSSSSKKKKNDNDSSSEESLSFPLSEDSDNEKKKEKKKTNSSSSKGGKKRKRSDSTSEQSSTSSHKNTNSSSKKASSSSSSSSHPPPAKKQKKEIVLEKPDDDESGDKSSEENSSNHEDDKSSSSTHMNSPKSEMEADEESNKKKEIERDDGYYLYAVGHLKLPGMGYTHRPNTSSPEEDELSRLRLAMSKDLDNTQCCGFCKSICTLSSCSTRNCPGPRTPKLIDREKIRKFQMRLPEKKQFKVFTEDPSNENHTFGVYCGTNIATTLDPKDPKIKHRKICQGKQVLSHDKGHFPFLVMTSVHKPDCPFKLSKDGKPINIGTKQMD